MNRYSWDLEFDGLKCIAVNKSNPGSQLFDSVWNEEAYDMMVAYQHVKGEHWTVSMYSTKENIDCSVIAKKHGGGGHKGAAGFQIKEFPFK